MATKVMCVYLVLCVVALWDISQANPIEYGNQKGKAPNDKFMQILAKQHSNNQQPLDKSDKAPVLRDLLYASKAYQPGGDNSEMRQMSMPDSANIPYSPLELLQALAEYETNDDYYQDQANANANANADGLYYTEGQDGWFDGPILPRVNAEPDETPFLEGRTAGASQDSPNEEQLNKLLINYLYDHYNKISGNELNEDEEDSNVEKRRQKIVIKDDIVDVTTPSTPKATTASTRKAKFLNKPIKASHNGQKEVALLRPANAAESKQKDWPQELEDNNLDEEDSLKEMQSQSRPVRDVLTSQLDSLKEEAQHKSGAVLNAKSSSAKN